MRKYMNINDDSKKVYIWYEKWKKRIERRTNILIFQKWEFQLKHCLQNQYCYTNDFD